MGFAYRWGRGLAGLEGGTNRLHERGRRDGLYLAGHTRRRCRRCRRGRAMDNELATCTVRNGPQVWKVGLTSTSDIVVGGK